MINGSKKFLRAMVRKLRSALGVEIIDVTGLTTETHHQELRQVAKNRKSTTDFLRKLGFAGPEGRYDIEYLNMWQMNVKFPSVHCSFQGTHYWYWSPLLEKSILESLVPLLRGEDLKIFPRILEAGSGNGQLLKKILELEYDSSMPDSEMVVHHRTSKTCDVRDLAAFEISMQSVRETRCRGIESFGGRLRPIEGVIKESKIDLIFLSYFIDRDSDQRETLTTAAVLLRKQDGFYRAGRLVLEGLFPCVMTDSNGVNYGTANVTRGNDAIEDIQLVVAELLQHDVSLERVLVGQRLVYSLDGPEVLPSYILVFKKN